VGAESVAVTSIQIGDQLASGPANGSASEMTVVFSSAAKLRVP